MDALERTPRVVAHPDPAALVREANHRIANQLSLIVGMVQLQASALARGPDMLTRSTVHRLLLETAGKIISISHLHRQLAAAPPGQDVDCAAYLVESCNALVDTLAPEGRLSIVYELGERWLAPAERAQALGLIAGEIIMNAMKYAHPAGNAVQVHMTCARDSSGCPFIEVYDDGDGLPRDFDEKKNGGVGFRLIRSLAAQIGAALRIESSSSGLCLRLTLPS